MKSTVNGFDSMDIRAGVIISSMDHVYFVYIGL